MTPPRTDGSWEICDRCDGTGSWDADPLADGTCPNCHGRGQEWVPEYDDFDDYEDEGR